MNKRIFLLAATALVSLAACGGDKAGEGSAATSEPVAAVKPPADGDWSKVASQTTAGGFMLGNPDARVKLIEIGALTCSHCREFEETGGVPLTEKYVKTGQVSWEFRPFLLNGLDVPANLIARCNGPEGFFPLMRAIYKDQAVWLGKIQAVPPAQLEQVQTLPPEQQFGQLAKLAGLQDWAAMRGVSQAKSDQCLKDQNAVTQLVQQTSDVGAQFPEFKGTPSFIINGKMTDGPQPGQSIWEALEPKIKEALGT